VQKDVYLIKRGKMKTIMSNLGFVPVPYRHSLISFLPNKDKNGNKFNVEPWDTEALKLQGRLFRGATSYPGRGSYRQIDEHGKIVEEVRLEQTRVVSSCLYGRKNSLLRL